MVLEKEVRTLKLEGTAKIGQLTKSNPGIRFNAKQFEATGMEVGEEVKVEYHKDKIVIKSVK